MTKAIFFDVDNTILSHKTGRIPESFLSSMEKLQAKGIKCVLTTGRCLAELRYLDLLKYGFDGYILVNGQLCLDENLQIIYERPYMGETKRQLVEAFNKHEFPIVLVEYDRLYSNFINQTMIDAQSIISSPPPDPGEYTGSNIYMASIFLPKEEASKVQIKGLRLFFFNDLAADLISETASKASGIQAYMNAYGISHEDTVAFGDGTNDVEMLEYVNLSIAMGNGCKEVKEIADYVTADIDDDGIQKALLHFGLID